jgi:hypothetical protein
VVRRICSWTNCDDETKEKIDGMIFSLIKSRDCIIEKLKKRTLERKLLITETAITGALRNTINTHGPITKEWIESAAKRIKGQIHVLKSIHEGEFDKNTITIIDNKTTTSKLTVTGTGDVRIKIAIGSTTEERERLIQSLTKVADTIRELKLGMTVRGRMTTTDSITLAPESEKFSIKVNMK